MITGSHKKIIFLPALLTCAIFFGGCNFVSPPNMYAPSPEEESNREVSSQNTDDAREKEEEEKLTEEVESTQIPTQDAENTEILYNPDGTIDTSNWNTCKIGAQITFKCPNSWRSDTGNAQIVNALSIVGKYSVKFNKDTQLPDDAIVMFLDGGVLDITPESDIDSYMVDMIKNINEQYKDCRSLVYNNIADPIVICRYKKDEVFYNESHRFKRVLDREDNVVITHIIVTFASGSERALSKNEKVMEKIRESYVLSGTYGNPDQNYIPSK